MGSDGTVFSVSYTGGDGNDIVLTVIAARSPNRAHGSAVRLRSLGSLSRSAADCGRRQFSDICSDECDRHRTPGCQIVYATRWSQSLAGAMTS